MIGQVFAGKCWLLGALKSQKNNGDGEVVEINKNLFGKRKFNTERLVFSIWGDRPANSVFPSASGISRP